MEDWVNTMENDAPHGTSVSVITKNGEIWNGMDYDKKQVAKYLKIGEVYHVDYTDIHAWATTVYLIEFPDIGFNSVNLKEV